MPVPDPRPSPPLLTQAVAGFRAWSLDQEGRLRAAAWPDHVWEPGVNVAACRNSAAHPAPDPDCTCGLHAFHSVHRQLSHELVVGAVAAWGAMQVYADGFRAERACVLALARRAAMTPAELSRLQRAASRYRVPIVSRSSLHATVALQTAALPVSVVAVEQDARARWLAQRRGYVPVDQVWVEPSAGVVTVGVTRAFRRVLGQVAHVALRPGDRLRRADDVRIVGEGAEVDLPLPVSGAVLAVNDLATMPASEPADPDGAAWLARIAPSDWPCDGADLDWGVAGRAAATALAERDGDRVVAHLQRATRAAHGTVTSWRDVGDVLRAERRSRARRTCASADEVYDRLAVTLGCAFERAPAVRRRLERLDTVIAFVTHDPAARVAFDLRRGRGTLACGPGGPGAAVEVSCSGADLVALLEGRLDLGRETRTGRLRIRGSRAAALSSIAVLVAWTRVVLGGDAVGRAAVPGGPPSRRTAVPGGAGR